MDERKRVYPFWQRATIVLVVVLVLTIWGASSNAAGLSETLNATLKKNIDLDAKYYNLHNSFDLVEGERDTYKQSLQNLRNMAYGAWDPDQEMNWSRAELEDIVRVMYMLMNQTLNSTG